MSMSNSISEMIFQMLEEKSEIEFKRNILAQNLGCVPSQINYVLSSRFTPEKGFVVESRRGTDGYIRITRVSYTEDSLLREVVSQTGDEIDFVTAKNYIINLIYHGILTERDAAFILAAVDESTLRSVPPEYRNRIRADLFRNMLIRVKLI